MTNQSNAKDIIFKITSREWKKRHKDFKTTIDNRKYIMKDSALIPVIIDDVEGQELRSYLFEDGILTYSCIAWSIDDAKQIIKSSGHYMPAVKNIRLKGTNV